MKDSDIKILTDLILLILGGILAIIIFAFKGLIIASLIVWGGKLFKCDLSEYFAFLWVAFSVFFMLTPSVKR